MGNVWQKSYIDVHEATQSGHIDEVRRWVDAGKPVDARDNTQKTPLHHAAQWGQEEALDFLIECGADVNAADFIEDTPLHLACYFGHANCARILIMVGADIAAKDCYGNTPSQIFDDHVTEPVLDEIRFIVREVTKGPCPAQDPEQEFPGSSSVCNQEASGGGTLRDNISSTTMRKNSGLSLHGGGNPETEHVVAAKGAVAGGAAGQKSESPGPPNDNEKIIENVSAAALGEVEGSGPSDTGQPLALGVAKEEKGDRSRIRSPDRSSDGLSLQQQTQEAGQEGSGARGGINREPDAATDEQFSGPNPSGTSTTREQQASETEGLAPRLKLSLPWENEGGIGLARTPGFGAEAAQSLIDAAGIGGGASARTVAGGGLASAGRTYPGGRPLSAPLMRPSISAGNLNSTSPILSGRRYEGTSVDLGGSRSLGRTAGASLAGRLMSYATRPGGTFDVFAAARDGQVSVLKQALTEGEDVDVQDEAGLTALMWAARAGRLSTAKYLVSQGANLERRDEATGFSPLHFAAYYCRSSVVRVLVLAGADTKATDNRGRTPGARFQPLSYLSYEAFHRRRLIRRFLAGDMKDGMDDKGKTMFPMNSPLEAYDEEHRPQCVRLGSRDNLTAHSDQSSAEEGYHRSSKDSGGAANRSRSRSGSRSRPHPYPGTSHRRASAEIARKAYATMHTMHSKVEDESSAKEKSMSEARGRGGRGSGGGSVGGSGGGGGGGGGGVRYYLRRASIQQVAAKTRKILAATNAGGSDFDVDNDSNGVRSRAVSNQKRPRSPSRPASSRGGECGVNFYLRRSSLQGLPLIENLLSGGAKGGERDAQEGRSGNGLCDDDDDQAAGVARDMAIAVASFEAAAAAAAAAGSRVDNGGNGHCASGSEEESVLGRVEAGRGARESSRGSGGESSREEKLARKDQGEEWGERGGGGTRTVSARLLEGIVDGEKNLSTQAQDGHAQGDNRRPSHDSLRGDRSPIHERIDVESGTRAIPPPEDDSSPVFYPGLGQEESDRQRQPEGSAAAASREHAETGTAADLASGGGGGDASLLAQPQGEKEDGGAIEASAVTTAEAVFPLGDSVSSRKASAAAELDSPAVGDGEHVANEDSGGVASVFGSPHAADEGLCVGNVLFPVDTGDEPTSCPERIGRAAAAEGPAPGAGIDRISSTERDNQLEKGPSAAAELQQNQGPTNLIEDQPDKLVSSLGSLIIETSRDEAAAATPFERSRIEPADIFSVGSMPSSVEEKGSGGMGGGADAELVNSGEESTSKGRDSSRNEGRSSERKSHKRRHKRSHRHRDKSSDEGGGKSRRRRSRDHGLLGSTSASTVTALAPLKRIPPPSLTSARAIHPGEGPVGEETSGGDDGGGGGAGAGVGDG